MRRYLAGLGCALALGCAGGEDKNKDGVADGVRVPDSVSVVAATQAVGSISGQIVDAKLAPLADADIVVVLGKPEGASSYKTKSDAEGNFALKSLPAPSSVQIIVSKADFGTVRVNSNVTGATGNFPVNDANTNVGQIGLFKLDGTFRVNVFLPNGRPAARAKAFMEVSSAGFQAFNGTYGSSAGTVSLEATVDDQGVLTFTKLPNLVDLARMQTNAFSTTLGLVIAGLDEDNDGRFEFVGTNVNYTPRNYITQGATPIILTDGRATTTLSVVGSNVDTLAGGSAAPLRNLLRASEAITVLFNQPVVESTIQVRITEENCGTAVASTKTLRAGSLLTIAPTAGWVANKEYNIAIRATSADNGGLFSRTGFFFVGELNSPTALEATAQWGVKKAMGNTMGDRLQTGDDLWVIFNTPIRKIGSTADAKVFVSADLNNNGMVGGMNDNGEFGSTVSTITITADEPTFDVNNGTFGCTASNYTTRWRVTNLPVPTMGLPIPTNMKVLLPKDISTTAGYQTIWGAPFALEVTGALSILP